MLHNLAEAVRELERTFSDAFRPYRPEQYYMRGPGPACRAKRAGAAPVPGRIDAAPALPKFAKAHA